MAHGKCHVHSYNSQILLTQPVVEYIASLSKEKENLGRNVDSVLKGEGGKVNICWELEAWFMVDLSVKGLAYS